MNDEALFAAALQITDPNAQLQYLQENCFDQAQLERLQGMLACDQQSHLIDQPAQLPETVLRPPTMAVGDRIGNYKLLEQIGEGGMGEVWVADQLEPMKRRVALKLIKPGMDSRTVLGRFEAERQALAVMDHPNIAKVLDAGTSSEGRPYFVMELVKGTPITEFCDARKLSTKQRLELFVPVCQAIQHAHMKGIIHRDIKPSNVLVALHDEVPVVKVIDFGVAKAIGQQLTDKTIYTGFGALVGTPAYMAPEQATFNQLDIDTRVDVYALGVLMYELLAGSPPIEQDRLRKAALDEVLRIIRDEEPPRPSQRLSTSQSRATIAATRGIEPTKLSALMKGEIDWIVMKALEKDRTRRYETANALSKDVQRYLTGDAVEACPPTWMYRLRKVYRRNKTAVLVGSAFIGLVLGAALMGGVLAVQARRAEKVANANEDSARRAEADAFQQRKQAEIERDTAQAARNELRRNHYLAAMALIPAAWKADNVSRVIELLDEQRPKPGDSEDIRGFEWHYWDRLCRGHTREMSLGEDVYYCAISGDGSRAAMARKTKDPLPEQVESRGSPVANYRIEIIDLATGRMVRELATLNARYFRLKLNQDGSRLLSLLDDGKSGLIAWDVATGRELIKMPLDDEQLPVSQIALSPSGRLVAVVEYQVSRRLFEEPSDQVRFTLIDLENAINSQKSVQFQLQRPVSKFLRSLVINDLCFNALEDQVAFLTNPRVQSTFTGGIQAEQLDCSVYHIDIRTMKARKVVDVAAEKLCIAFTPDGKHLTGITAGPERLLRWDISNPDQWKEVLARQLAFSIHRSDFLNYKPPFAIQHSPDGRTILLTTIYSTTWIIDAETGDLRRIIKSPGNTRAASFAHSDVIRAIFKQDEIKHTDIVMQEWDFAKAQATNRANDTPRIRTIHSPDGERQAVYLLDENKVSIRNRHGKELHSFAVAKLGEYQEPTRTIDPIPTKTKWSLPSVLLTFSQNGRYLCVRENKVPYGFTGPILETDTGKVCWTPVTTNINNDPLDRMMNRTITILSPDQRYLALFGAGQVQVVSLDNPEDRLEIKTESQSNGTFSPDGKRLLVEDRQSWGSVRDVGRMQLWDLDNKRLIRTENYGPPYDAFSADSQYFATVAKASDGKHILHFGNAANGEELWTAILSDPNGSSLAIHPRGKSLISFSSMLLSQGRRSAPIVWDAATGKILGLLEGFSGRLDDVLYSPDGTRIATLSRTTDDHIEVRLWDATTFQELLTLTHWRVPFGTLSFSSDGNKLTYDTYMIPEDPNYGGITWNATPQVTGKK